MKSKEKYNPYVVSADTGLLMKKWGETKGLVTPNSKFYQEMLQELKLVLKGSFNDVEIISESDLKSGLDDFIQTSASPVISLDRTYVDASQPNLLGFLDATRTVNTLLENTGLNSRDRDISLEKQIIQLAKMTKGKPVSLLDDVIFEGNTLLELIQLFRKKGVDVNQVYTGIAIQEGIDLLEANRVEVKSVITPYEQVIDEVCERDFRVGAPYSGRTIIDGDNTLGAPYFLPFGKPTEWAAIPEDKAVDFSLFCLYQSLQMWVRVEKLSQQSIPTKQLPKLVYGLENNDSVVNSLQQSIQQLENKEI